MAAPDSSTVVEIRAPRVHGETIREALITAESLIRSGDYARAEEAYNEILQAAPDDGEAWFYLGVISQHHEKTSEAIERYRRAIELAPNSPEARNNLGVLLQGQGQVDEAENCFTQALALDPNYAEAHNNLGNALQDQGRFAEAEAAYQRALLIKPDYVDAIHHLGNALGALGREREALKCYNEALRIDSGRMKIRLCRAMAWLQMGDYLRGWDEYEWRLQCPGQTVAKLAEPLWNGEPLNGQTILIIAEQGLGDTIQFIRYVTLVAQRGGRVTVACRKPLQRILATCPGVENVLSEKDRIPSFSCYSPLMSLPRVFGTSLYTVPAQVPYLFPDEGLISRWRKEFESTPEFKLGVVWQGNPQHRKDRPRSFRLNNLEPFSRITGVRLFSLQKGYGAEQISELDGRFQVTDLSVHLDDLVDTAVVLKNLDLLITADTSVAHLAGALGVPTWLAIPAAADWRWLREREDSPWYPSLRLFRQRESGAWDELFGRMATTLQVQLETRHRAA
jgi:Flp pilus assembly protein TadD